MSKTSVHFDSYPSRKYSISEKSFRKIKFEWYVLKRLYSNGILCETKKNADFTIFGTYLIIFVTFLFLCFNRLQTTETPKICLHKRPTTFRNEFLIPKCLNPFRNIPKFYIFESLQLFAKYF